MTTKKTSRRALFTSVMALVMCLVMLVGTTFAWFTDSVTSGVNIIKSGNLDVELWYKNAAQKEDFAKVDENTNVFIDGALWEPGHVEYAVLKVANVGSLALKYKLGINVAEEQGSTNVLGSEFKLSDYLQFAVLTDEVDVSNRTALVTAAEAATHKSLSEGYAVEESLLAGTDSAKVVTLVVWMPTTVGNEANYDKANNAAQPTIKLGINLVATQEQHEQDSFDNTYDAQAAYPSSAADIAATYGSDGMKMPDGVVIANEADGQSFTITLNDEEAFVYFTQVFDRAKAFEARKAAWDAGEITKQPNEYNLSSLNMWYGSYCNKITVKMGCDVDMNNMTVSPFGLSGYEFNFDGAGHTIKNAKVAASTGDAGFFASRVNITNVTLDNIHVSATGCNSAGVVAGAPNSIISKVTVKNSSVTGAKYTGAVAGYDYGDVIDCKVENTVVSGQYKVGGIVGYICGESNENRSVTGNVLTDVTVKGENIWPGKESNGFVVGQIVGNWNAINGTCNNNTFSGTTDATDAIGEVESRATAGLTQ